MADIELVIKISEEDYNDICNSETASNYSVLYALDGIRNGTPLPKGHGDLIDRNEAEKIADKKFEHITSSLLNYIQTYDVYNLLEATPTIIEAEREGEDEHTRPN